MARWKALFKFLLSVIGLFFLSLTVEALQGKRCQDSLLSGGGRSVWTKISGVRRHPWEIYFGFYKTRQILLSDSANCVPSFWHNTGVWWTDGQTDGIAVAGAALAMRSLLHAVKIKFQQLPVWKMNLGFGYNTTVVAACILLNGEWPLHVKCMLRFAWSYFLSPWNMPCICLFIFFIFHWQCEFLREDKRTAPG